MTIVIVQGEAFAVAKRGGIGVIHSWARRKPALIAWHWPGYRAPKRRAVQPAAPCTPCEEKARRAQEQKERTP